MRTFVLNLLTLAVGACLWTSAYGGTISGTVTVWGHPQGGQFIEVSAHTTLGDPPVDAQMIGLAGGAYTLDVPDGSYFVAVVFDRDGLQQEPAPEDVLVWYDADANGRADSVAAGDVTNVDVDIGYVYADVDAVGAADGTSWADAYPDLNMAITNTPAGVELWVADGIYVPGSSRSSSFIPRNGVRLYGGFAGNETLRTQRDLAANRTVLSCEIGSPSTPTDNCYHVVNAAGVFWEGALLDGFWITRGHADGPDFDNIGGGVYARFGGLMIANSVITDNFANMGGAGIVEVGGFVPVYNTLFLDNRTPFGAGGGYRGSLSGAPMMNCVFTANSAFRGGAIALEGGSFAPLIRNVVAYGNVAGGEGSGMWVNNQFGVTFSVANSIFWGNTGPGAQVTAWVLAPAIDYSIVQGGYAGSGTQILTDDPLFNDPDGADDTLGTADDDLSVQLTSPAIDAGDNAAVPGDLADIDWNHRSDETVTVDFAGQRRFVDIGSVVDTGSGAGPIVDIGAFEAALPETVFESGFERGEGGAG